MTFSQLRDALIERGCTRKQATLAVRLARGLESKSSLCRSQKFTREAGESCMSQKVGLQEFEFIHEVSEIVAAIDRDIL